MTNYRRIVVWVMSVLVALTCLNISPSKAIAAETNLVVNGSFEEPVVEYVSFENPIPGWDISESVAVEMRRPFTEKLGLKPRPCRATFYFYVKSIEYML
ncbi:hypothetical protein [Okeania sp. SIO2B3]|uniref:hypothetical protein n=1 Tax=Okeania sp. SIO2B3 TaxID=2607784 RepID=UPI0013C1E7FE|nr:hypothetical protein [Okeania sp. SIO2B3]NET45072.1 hypothetical protein [Okeania sp. SIO2B3]